MNLGVVGTGSIVDRFIDATKAVRGVRCIAIFSRGGNTGNAKNLAEKYEVENVYDDYSLMLLNKEIDFVYIASPNSLHYEQAKLALTAGKNVICEKPFAASFAQAQELLQLAQELKLFLFEGIPLIHAPSFKELQVEIQKLQGIKTVQCNYAQYSSRFAELKSGLMTNIFNLKFAGGSLMDINIYNLHFCIGLFGSPRSVQYLANKHETKVDTSGMLLLGYDGFTCMCFGAKDSMGVNFAQIEAENGFIYVPNGVNGMDRFEMNIDNVLSECIVGETSKRLDYEIEAFKTMFESGNPAVSYELFKQTLQVMQVIDQATADAQIVFG